VPVAATSRLEDDGFAAAAYTDVEAGQPWILSPKSGADDDDRPPPAAASPADDTPAAAAAVPAVTPREEPAG